MDIIYNLKKQNFKLRIGTKLFISQLIIKIVILTKYLLESEKRQLMYKPMS